MDRDGLSVFDTVVLFLGGAVVLLVAVAWAGAALALVVTGEPVEIP